MSNDSLTVLFMHMNEENPFVTPTMLERTVLFCQMYIDKIKCDRNDAKSEFLIVGGARAVKNEGIEEVVDLMHMEERIKKIAISLLSSIGLEHEPDYEMLAGEISSMVEPGGNHGDNESSINYQKLIGKLVEIVKSLRRSLGDIKIDTGKIGEEFLKSKIHTEEEIRREYNEPHNSITTAANIDIILEYLSRNPNITELNLLSSPEHMHRIHYLFETRIDNLTEEILRMPHPEDDGWKFGKISRFVALRRRLSKMRKDYGYENELKINYVSSGNILGREMRIRPIPILITDVMTEVAAEVARVTGLYSLAEKYTQNNRKGKGEKAA